MPSSCFSLYMTRRKLGVPILLVCSTILCIQFIQGSYTITDEFGLAILMYINIMAVNTRNGRHILYQFGDYYSCAFM